MNPLFDFGMGPLGGMDSAWYAMWLAGVDPATREPTSQAASRAEATESDGDGPFGKAEIPTDFFPLTPKHSGIRGEDGQGPASGGLP